MSLLKTVDHWFDVGKNQVSVEASLCLFLLGQQLSSEFHHQVGVGNEFGRFRSCEKIGSGAEIDFRPFKRGRNIDLIVSGLQIVPFGFNPFMLGASFRGIVLFLLLFRLFSLLLGEMSLVCLVVRPWIVPMSLPIVCHLFSHRRELV